MLHKRKGFTLIELLVVIAIIGLLSTLAIIALDSAREKSRDAKRITDIKQIQTALELYFNDQKQYPNSDSCIGPNTVGVGTCSNTASVICLDSTDAGFEAACATGPGAVTYMSQVPADPIPSPSDAIEYSYRAQCSGAVCGPTDKPTSYILTFDLEGRVDNFAAGTHQATPNGVE